jgi:hypothetical protein
MIGFLVLTVWIVCGIIPCVLWAREFDELDLTTGLFFLIGGFLGLCVYLAMNSNTDSIYIWKKKR